MSRDEKIAAMRDAFFTTSPFTSDPLGASLDAVESIIRAEVLREAAGVAHSYTDGIATREAASVAHGIGSKLEAMALLRKVSR
jgi:hypothetical protein